MPCPRVSTPTRSSSCHGITGSCWFFRLKKNIYTGYIEGVFFSAVLTLTSWVSSGDKFPASLDDISENVIINRCMKFGV